MFLSSQKRYFSPLLILVALTGLCLSISLLYWEGQNWTQHSRCDFMSDGKRAGITSLDLLSIWLISDTTSHPFHLSNFYYFLGKKIIFVPQMYSWIGAISTKKWNHISITYAALMIILKARILAQEQSSLKWYLCSEICTFFILIHFCISKTIYTLKNYLSVLKLFSEHSFIFS